LVLLGVFVAALVFLVGFPVALCRGVRRGRRERT
jgi:hypothetical protein